MAPSAPTSMPLPVSVQRAAQGTGTDANPTTIERPETPPNPSAMLPFSRDPSFVKRQIILDQIDKKCAVLGSWTALVGFGGVG